VRGGRACDLCDVCATARSSQQLQGRDRSGTGPRSGSFVSFKRKEDASKDIFPWPPAPAPLGRLQVAGVLCVLKLPRSPTLS
jgi:hypothetical protein